MAILSGITQACQNRWPGRGIVAPTRNPGAFKRWKIPANPVPEADLVRVVDSASVVMMTAATYQRSDFERFGPVLGRAHQRGVPVLAANAGFPAAPVMKDDREQARLVLSLHHRAAWRDRDSLTIARGLCPALEQHAFADMAHTVIPQPKRTRPSYVGLNVNHTMPRETIDAMLAAARFAARRLRVPVTILKTAEADHAVSVDLQERHDLPAIEVSKMAMDRAVNAVSGAALIVANRLHMTLLATSLAVPVVAVPWESKVRAYLSEIGLPELVADTPGDLATVTADAVGNRSHIARHLQDMNRKRAGLARAGFRWLTEGLS